MTSADASRDVHTTVTDETGSEVFAVPAGSLEIRVIAVDGDITVTTSDRRDIGISWFKSGSGRSPISDRVKLLIEQHGDLIEVRPDFDGDFNFNWNFGWDNDQPLQNISKLLDKAAQAISAISTSQVLHLNHLGGHWAHFDVMVDLPRDLPTAQLQLFTASGSIKVDDARVRRLGAKSASGDIRLAHVNTDASVYTASGDVRLNDLTGPLELRSVSGDLNVVNLRTPRSRIDTVSGDVLLVLSEEDAGNHEMKSVSGDFRVVLPASIESRGAEIYFASVSGSARGVKSFREIGTKHWRIGSTSMTNLRVQTVSGDLVVEQAQGGPSYQPDAPAAREVDRAPLNHRERDHAPQTAWRSSPATPPTPPVPPAPPVPPVPDASFVAGFVDDPMPADFGTDGELDYTRGGATTITTTESTETEVTDSSAEATRRSILERVERGELDIDEALAMLERV